MMLESKEVKPKWSHDFSFFVFEVRAVGCWPKSLTTLALFIWENTNSKDSKSEWLHVKGFVKLRPTYTYSSIGVDIISVWNDFVVSLILSLSIF